MQADNGECHESFVDSAQSDAILARPIEAHNDPVTVYPQPATMGIEDDSVITAFDLPVLIPFRNEGLESTGSRF